MLDFPSFFKKNALKCFSNTVKKLNAQLTSKTQKAKKESSHTNIGLETIIQTVEMLLKSGKSSSVNTCGRITELLNSIGWKSPLRLLSPTVNLILPGPLIF